MAIFVGNITLWKYSPFDVVPLKWAGKLAMTQGVFAALFLGIVRLVDLSPWLSLLVFPPLGLVLFLGINVMVGYIPTQPAQPYLRRVTKYLS